MIHKFASNLIRGVITTNVACVAGGLVVRSLFFPLHSTHPGNFFKLSPVFRLFRLRTRPPATEAIASVLLLVPAAKRGTSLGLPRVFFLFVSRSSATWCNTWYTGLRSQVLRIQSELNKIKSFHILSTSWHKYTLLERLVFFKFVSRSSATWCNTWYTGQRLRSQVFRIQSELNKIKSFHILSTSWQKYTLLERLVLTYI